MICLCPIICDVPINLMFLLVKSCGTYHVRVYLHDMSHVATYCSRYICGQVMSQRFKGRDLGVLDLHCQSATLYLVEMEAGPVGCHRWRHTLYHHLLQTLVHIIRGGFRGLCQQTDSTRGGINLIGKLQPVTVENPYFRASHTCSKMPVLKWSLVSQRKRILALTCA